jgi:uncharacterized protein DUF6448
MKASLTVVTVLAVFLLTPLRVKAHCDAEDGPVGIAARKALETKNVNLVFPYVPAEFEVELTAAFQQALGVRDKGPEARALSDRYFMETAVRLHRAGEKAPYMGLKPAGTDFGAAIRAAEKALESGTPDALIKLLSQELTHEIAARLGHALSKKAATKEPTTKAEVQAARERVNAELGLIGYVEGVHLAITGGGHAE